MDCFTEVSWKGETREEEEGRREEGKVEVVAVATGEERGERGVGNEIWLRVQADDSHTPEIWVLLVCE